MVACKINASAADVVSGQLPFLRIPDAGHASVSNHKADFLIRRQRTPQLSGSDIVIFQILERKRLPICSDGTDTIATV